LTFFSICLAISAFFMVMLALAVGRFRRTVA